MIKDKLMDVLMYAHVTQVDIAKAYGTIPQTINKKFKFERFTYTDIIKICEMCGCEVVICDKKTGDIVTTLTMDDCREHDFHREGYRSSARYKKTSENINS